MYPVHYWHCVHVALVSGVFWTTQPQVILMCACISMLQFHSAFTQAIFSLQTAFPELRVFWKVLSTNWSCCYWLLHSSVPVRFWWTSSLWRKAREWGGLCTTNWPVWIWNVHLHGFKLFGDFPAEPSTAERRDLLEAHNSLWCIRICRNKFNIIYQTILIVNIHTPNPTRACFWKQLENFIYMCKFTGECGKYALANTVLLGSLFFHRIKKNTNGNWHFLSIKNNFSLYTEFKSCNFEF